MLTPETEEKLMQAVSQAAGFVEAGCSPNEAIVKAAKATGVPSGAIDTLVHAYNTGKTNSIRLSNEGLLSKVAEFELADSNAVLEQLHGQTKQASVVDTRVAEIYSQPPRREPPVDTWLEKAAAACQPVLPQYMSAKTASAGSQRLRNAVTTAHDKLTCEREKLAAAVDRIASYFYEPDAMPLSQVLDTARLCLAADEVAVLSHITKDRPGFSKVANFRPRRADDVLGRPYCDLREAAGLATTVSQCLLDVEAAEKQAGDLSFSVAGLQPAISIPEISFTTTSCLPEDELEKTGGVAGMGLAGYGLMSAIGDVHGDVAQGIKPRSSSDATQKALEQITDPEHEGKLRGLESQATMADLVNHDDVISGYHPDEIADAYDSIVQLSPRIANQKLLLQAALRRQLQQGSLDTFDLDQILGMDEKLKKRDMIGAGNDASVI